MNYLVKSEWFPVLLCGAGSSPAQPRFPRSQLREQQSREQWSGANSQNFLKLGKKKRSRVDREAGTICKVTFAISLLSGRKGRKLSFWHLGARQSHCQVDLLRWPLVKSEKQRLEMLTDFNNTRPC